MSFAQFMQEQIDAIAASGLDPLTWIEQHSQAFRETHPVDDTNQETQS